MNISDEAVEAAARAAHVSKLTGVRWEDAPKWKISDRLSDARAALEAAAPHLMAEAWDEGWQKAHATDDPPMAGIFLNPYRSAGAGE